MYYCTGLSNKGQHEYDLDRKQKHFKMVDILNVADVTLYGIMSALRIYHSKVLLLSLQVVTCLLLEFNLFFFV